jgi:hypothetical protein
MRGSGRIEETETVADRIVELQVHDVFDAIAKIAICGGKGRCGTGKKQRGGCACGAVNHPVHLDVLCAWEWSSF